MVYWKLVFVVLLLQITQTDAQRSSHKNFLQWKQQQGKSYVDQTEELYRYYVYSQNVKNINWHNSDPSHGFELGVNQFTDLTWQEIQNTYLNTLPPPDNDSNYQTPVKKDNLKKDVEENDDEDTPVIGVPPTDNNYPQFCQFYYDYSVINATLKNNHLLPVQHQGGCGSCYAFASAAVLTFQASFQKNIIYIASEQQILDCANGTDYGNYHCNGGWLTGTYKYGAITNIARKDHYPYLGFNVTCRNKTTTRGPVRVLSRANTPANDCSAMVNRLKSGTAAVALNANKHFMAYKKGVITLQFCPASGVNHAVYLVGVDTCGVWKIQNSWGTGWGESGFMRLAPGNTCNICAYGAYYATLA